MFGWHTKLIIHLVLRLRTFGTAQDDSGGKINMFGGDRIGHIAGGGGEPCMNVSSSGCLPRESYLNLQIGKVL